MNNLNIEFDEILYNIKESMSGFDMKCPKCKSPNIKIAMQSFGIIDDKYCDSYSYKCFNCDNHFNIVSKPLKHFEGLENKLK